MIRGAEPAADRRAGSGDSRDAGATLRTIIKWPGGKAREFAAIEALLPPFSTWVEPFVGGGAFFFRLEPGQALLNDAEGDLIDLYAAVRDGSAELSSALLRMVRDRARVKSLVPGGLAGFCRHVEAVRRGGEASRFEPPGDFELEGVDVAAALRRSVVSKAGRIVGLERKHEKVFSDRELTVHFETALQAGYYTCVRDQFAPADRAGQLARFYFLRQLCYGSMFRYSRDGKFNIPYGGISYNRADFATKVDRLLSPGVRSLLARAELTCLDFDDQLKAVWPRLSRDAFVFLDPPYDTEFSDYANRSFGRAEQDRLARTFATLPCPALLVIQQSDYVLWLYEGIGRELRARKRPFHLESYEKVYGYNVRGRNDRKAEHLLIMNYHPPARSSKAVKQ
jgi:DNA adenine methylase